MKKYILSTILFLSLGLVSVQAQHEFSIYGAGGIATLQYKSTQGAIESGIGGIGGLGYSYNFSPSWGINTGLEIALFGATAKQSEIQSSSKELYDYNGRTEDLFFNGAFTNYEEKQDAMYLQIPLMLQFRAGEANALYAAAGVKIGFALSGNSKISADKLITSGYYPETEQTFVNIPDYGYTTTTGISSSPKLDLGLNVSLAAEAGYRWKIGEKLALYTGAYIDYGISNVLPSKEDGDLLYRPADDLTKFSYNSLLTASSLDGEYVDKLNLFSVGVKVKLAFSVGK
jgi:hypothetical protein